MRALPPGTTSLRTGRRWLAVFLLTTLILTAIVASAAWFTGLREWSYGVLLALGALALGPLLIALSGAMVILLTTVLAALGALFGAVNADETISGGDIVAAGRRATPGYFRFLTNTRSPVLCGVPAGLAMGVVLITAIQWWHVLPREARTAATLLNAQAQIQRVYDDSKRFPKPDAAGNLPLGSLYPDQKKRDAGVLRDAFGHALTYRVDGVWRAASWSLVSAGIDGRIGTDDDLCVEGRTSLDGVVREARTAAMMAQSLFTQGRLNRKESIDALSQVRCHERARRVSPSPATPSSSP